jgi:hypothetical protein
LLLEKASAKQQQQEQEQQQQQKKQRKRIVEQRGRRDLRIRCLTVSITDVVMVVWFERVETIPFQRIFPSYP